jgi:hypothetical protein
VFGVGVCSRKRLASRLVSRLRCCLVVGWLGCQISKTIFCFLSAKSPRSPMDLYDSAPVMNPMHRPSRVAQLELIIQQQQSAHQHPSTVPVPATATTCTKSSDRASRLRILKRVGAVLRTPSRLSSAAAITLPVAPTPLRTNHRPQTGRWCRGLFHASNACSVLLLVVALLTNLLCKLTRCGQERRSRGVWGGGGGGGESGAASEVA